MANSKFNKDWPTVICSDNGFHTVVMPNGDEVTPIIKTVVTDECGDYPYIEVTMFCNIAKDKEDAARKYKEVTLK